MPSKQVTFSSGDLVKYKSQLSQDDIDGSIGVVISVSNMDSHMNDEAPHRYCVFARGGKKSWPTVRMRAMQ